MTLTTMDVVVTRGGTGLGHRRGGGGRGRGTSSFQHMMAGFQHQSIFMLISLGALVVFWFICLFILVAKLYASGILSGKGLDGADSFLRGGSLIGPHSSVMQFHAGNLIPPPPIQNIIDAKSPPHRAVEAVPSPKQEAPKSISSSAAAAAAAASVAKKKTVQKPNVDKHDYLYPPWHQKEEPNLLNLSRGGAGINNNNNDSNNKMHPVKITTDVRGNLGPPEVMLQDPPGTHWIRDRWQAASDMGGTAIPGSHWVQIEFPHPVRIDEVVLDWEAAYADEYILFASLHDMHDKTTTSATTTTTTDTADGNEDGDIWTLFDATNPQQRDLMMTKMESGQSPGTETFMPLHVVHTIEKISSPRYGRYLKLWIRKPGVHGWGVSLWQIDVYGVYEKQKNPEEDGSSLN
jgi:hypothetical protein